MKKFLVVGIVTVLTIISLASCGSENEIDNDLTSEVVIVVSSVDGVVTVENSEGETWECYGCTEELILTAFFDEGELVDFKTVNEIELTVLDVVNVINCEFIVKNESLEIISNTQSIDKYINEIVKSVSIVDDVEEFEICILI